MGSSPAPDPFDRERLRRLGDKLRRRLAANEAIVRLSTDRAELWATGHFFTADECAGLIARIDAVAAPSWTYATDATYRTSCSGNLHPADPLVRGLQRRMDRLLGVNGSHAEMLQGQRYTPGQEFKPHVDWFHPGSPGWIDESPNGGQRAFTAMAYLNDVTDGGETDFPRLDLAIAPRAGTLLVWNNADRDGTPNEFTVHAGNPLRSGVKYVVTRWYRCRATRQPD